MSKGKSFRKVKPGEEVTKLNDEIIEKICNNLRLGSYIETAVVMAGVRKQTFYNWCKLAHEKPRSIYMRLLDAVEKAQEEATTRDLLNIDKCAMGREPVYMRDENGGIVFSENGKPVVLQPGILPDASLSTWRLERRRPKEWGRTEKLDHSSSDGSMTPKDNSLVVTFVDVPDKKDE